jgi:predicted transcriptional regulator
MEQEETRQQFEEAAYLLKAVANETRLGIIMQLSKKEEKSVTELMEVCSVNSRCYHIILPTCGQKEF